MLYYRHRTIQIIPILLPDLGSRYSHKYPFSHEQFSHIFIHELHLEAPLSNLGWGVRNVQMCPHEQGQQLITQDLE